MLENENQNMPEQEPHMPMPMSQHTMRLGIVIGICMALDFILSASEGTGLKFLSFFVEAYIIIQSFRMARLYRDMELGGYISFKSAFKYIFMLFFFGAIIAAFVRIIYLRYIDTDLLSRLYNQTMLTLELIGIELPDGSEDLFEGIFTPARFALYGIFGDCIDGALLGLIYAPFIKRKKMKIK